MSTSFRQPYGVSRILLPPPVEGVDAGPLGQLAPAHQARRAEERAGITRDECEWYHTFDLPDGEVIVGAWDLRGGEDAYLGETEFLGRRVLELGPASGYVTFHMERQGAEVVALDAGAEAPVAVLPVDGSDMSHEQAKVMATVDRLQNAWWYMHHRYQSSAVMVRGDVYDLPDDLGRFDVSVFAAILLHLREPWGALSQAAARTTGRIVVTDLVPQTGYPLESNVMQFSPLATHEITNWWLIYPGAVVTMLERLGFGRTRIIEHTQAHHLGHRLDEPAVAMPMYTVVGERV
jgi:O-methyltransferase